MGAVKSKVDVEVIHHEVQSTPVVIYTKDGCGFCAKARELLNKEGIEYKDCNVDRIKEDTPDAYQARVNGLVYMTHQTTMPQIFICGNFVGGFTDLEKLRETRRLWDVLATCTEENDLLRITFSSKNPAPFFFTATELGNGGKRRTGNRFMVVPHPDNSSTKKFLADHSYFPILL
ncbi:unnamed protein product [Cylicocyclus nassatus]|uniref:Glutaredoxin domain-containing protein n=1 Tax=Cylicocyclus nassatus TaxID=53992 RepID=A0AA36M6Y9_CYLNA|nr:unnamed protein product [Cylicocyclus nassatus]